MKVQDLFEGKTFNSSTHYFHGGHIKKSGKDPIFFTTNFDDAKEFVDMAPTPSGKYVVYEATLAVNKMSKLKDLKAVIKELGLKDDDVEDDSDFLMNKTVVARLKLLGFDGWTGNGIASGFNITEHVVFDRNQIKVVKIHEIEE